jgi:hypothetical protein
VTSSATFRTSRPSSSADSNAAVSLPSVVDAARPEPGPCLPAPLPAAGGHPGHHALDVGLRDVLEKHRPEAFSHRRQCAGETGRCSYCSTTALGSRHDWQTGSCPTCAELLPADELAAVASAARLALLEHQDAA